MDIMNGKYNGERIYLFKGEWKKLDELEEIEATLYEFLEDIIKHLKGLLFQLFYIEWATGIYVKNLEIESAYFLGLSLKSGEFIFNCVDVDEPIPHHIYVKVTRNSIKVEFRDDFFGEED